MNKAVRYSHSGGLCDRDMGMGFPPQDVISALGFLYVVNLIVVCMSILTCA